MGRRLGQHFLASPTILEQIAVAACPAPEPVVVEIGPGKGALTRHLLERSGRLIGIEIDARLVAGLAREFPGVELVHSDVLDVDLSQWGPSVFAGNLPYYITSPIVDKLLETRACKWAVLLIQKEVAERLTAKPGSRDYGYLTVATQARARTEYLFTVPRGVFRPPPKVDSAVVRLTPAAEPPPAGFLEFAGRCFRQKRKMLRNNLAGRYPEIDRLPEGTKRAEQIPVADLQALFSRLSTGG